VSPIKAGLVSTFSIKAKTTLTSHHPVLKANMFALVESLFRLVMWGVTMWLDKSDLVRQVAALSGMLNNNSKTTCSRSDSDLDSTVDILTGYSSSSSMSDSFETEEGVASWGKTIITMQLSDADDVQSETEDRARFSPPASWGPSSPAKLPTPLRPATIFCEVGSHGQLYGAGFTTLCKLLALLCVKVTVRALPSGFVWGDVVGFSVEKVETSAGNISYELHPVEQYWVDDCPHGLSTAHDIHKAFKDANDFW